MEPGRMTERVGLLRRDVSPSSTGSGVPVERFVVEATVWAEVRPVRGNEAHVALLRVSETTHIVRIWHRTDIDETWRLRWRDRDYDIDEIRPGGEQLREYLEILATTGNAERVA